MATTLSTLISAAQAAIAADDWTTAENKLLQAQAELIGLPDQSDGRRSMQFRQSSQIVESLLARVRRKSSITTGHQRQSIKYATTPATDDDC